LADWKCAKQAWDSSVGSCMPPLRNRAGIEEAGFKEGIHRRFHFRNQNRLTVLVARLVLVTLAVVRGEEFSAILRAVPSAASKVSRLCSAKRSRWVRPSASRTSYSESQIAGAEQRLGHGGYLGGMGRV
jgi:hypothetical protein